MNESPNEEAEQPDKSSSPSGTIPPETAGSPGPEPQTRDESASVESENAEPRFERRWSKRASSTPSATPVEVGIEAAMDAQKEKARADELYERLQRSMADLSNYRKRVEAEREEMAKLASMLLVAELLPVLDNFERALESIPRELEMFSWLQGVALIERHLRAILERQGVEPIEAMGKDFNPSLHEAIVEEEVAETKPGTIVGELQRGYTMHGRVIRPTLAKVAKAPTSPSSSPQAGEEASAGSATEATSGMREVDEESEAKSE
jgi:molecular chaperone GrpE